MGDVGVPATAELVRRLEARGELGDLNAALARKSPTLFGEPPVLHVDGQPKRHSSLSAFNRHGKTTTIGKLAAKLSQHGHSVVVAAADTFRAAAEEQLDIWAQRAVRRLRRLRARRRPCRCRLRRDRGGAGARARPSSSSTPRAACTRRRT